MSLDFSHLASGEDIDAELKALARFTDVAGEMTRLSLSPAHKDALDYLQKRFQAAGMETFIDPMGSLHGRYNPHGANTTIIIGSHIDTVRNAGIYDGSLGVIIGLKVIEALAKSGQKLSHALELIAFGDEEGVRFPTTLTGSLYVAGQFNPAWLDERDADGVERRTALAALGAPAVSLPHQAQENIAAYLEVHIEQGPVLQAQNLPLGLVSAINGVTRGTITIKGTAGHAGTLPMAMRNDALTAAAEMALAFEARAKQTPDLVATNGVLTIKNPAINVVAGDVTMSFDVRSPRDEDRLRALDDIFAQIKSIAARRGVEVSINIGHQALATPCDENVMQSFAHAAKQCDATPITLPSGAGHDAMAFRNVAPLAMLFVRCKDGISHNPAESIKPEDVGLAARVLMTALVNM